MSLIDDALKRAQAADEAAARSVERPWIPTPMPDPAIARRRALARGLGIFAVAAAVAGAGVWVALRVVPESASRPTGGGRAPTTPAAAVVPPPSPTPDAVAVATPIVVPPPVRVAPEGAASLLPRPARPARPTMPAEAAAAPPAAEVLAAQPARPSRDAAGGRTYAGAATLPGGGRIELGGIVWSETEPRALVNDRVVGTGSYVEGWSVTRIDEDRVVLEKDGATLTITVK